MLKVWLLYGTGVACASLALFLFPVLGAAAFGFVPLSVGLVWAAYDLVEVAGGESASTEKRRSSR